MKGEQCQFHRTQVQFLGYVIRPDMVAMDEKKVAAIQQWPHPRTTKELQCFLGFAHFYRRFIRNFSQVAAPLTSLTWGSSSQFSWTPESGDRVYVSKTSFLRSLYSSTSPSRIPILGQGRRLGSQCWGYTHSEKSGYQSLTSVCLFL